MAQDRILNKLREDLRSIEQACVALDPEDYKGHAGNQKLYFYIQELIEMITKGELVND